MITAELEQLQEIEVIQNIPTKKELSIASDNFVQKKGIALDKYLTLKALEFFVKDGLEKLKEQAKTSFIEIYGGVTKQEAQGVTIQLADMSKSIAMKEYAFSDSIQSEEADIKALEEEIKLSKDALKIRKLQEINSGTAKPMDSIFQGEPKDHYTLKIILTD